jgi:orotidine-5'-phosphate decarboxylase
MNQKSKICLALDGLTADEGIDMVSKMGRQVRAVKIHDLLDWNGPEYLDELHAIGVDPWVDYKLHDTRDTVGLRVRALVAILLFSKTQPNFAQLVVLWVVLPFSPSKTERLPK